MKRKESPAPVVKNGRLICGMSGHSRDYDADLVHRQQHEAMLRREREERCWQWVRALVVIASLGLLVYWRIIGNMD